MTEKTTRKIRANDNGLINPRDLLTLSQEDGERMIKEVYTGSRDWKTGRAMNGDMRIGIALVSMRISFGFPRSTIASLSGVGITSITRVETGMRALTVHSLSRIMTGLRDGVAMLWPGRRAEFDKWVIDFLYLVATVEEETRLRKNEYRLQNFKGKQEEGEE